MSNEIPTTVRPGDLRPGDFFLFGPAGSRSVVEVWSGPTVVTDDSGTELDCFKGRASDGQPCDLVFRRDAHDVQLVHALPSPAGTNTVARDGARSRTTAGSGEAVQTARDQSRRDAETIRDQAEKLRESTERIRALEAELRALRHHPVG